MKKQIIEQIVLYLEQELADIQKAANTAHQTATHEESVAENKYDTFGLEASYLAEGLSRRVEEIKSAIATYQSRVYSEITDGVIRLGAQVELGEDEHDQSLYFFIGPAGAGIKLRADDCDYKVVTPMSPIGQALMGREEGEVVSLMLNGSTVRYEILLVQ